MKIAGQVKQDLAADFRRTIAALEGKRRTCREESQLNITRLALTALTDTPAAPIIHPDCGSAGMGTYSGMVTVKTPQGKIASIDACIFSEVTALWERGIVTVESCCGHGVAESYIAVAPEFEQQMVDLGYERFTGTDAPAVFVSKTSRHGFTHLKAPLKLPSKGVWTAYARKPNEMSNSDAVRGWNARLAEVERLNATAPAVHTGFDPAGGNERTIIVYHVAPSGWKMVPIEPTRQMMSQGHFAMGGTDRGKFRRIYQAMIAAAPEVKSES